MTKHRFIYGLSVFLCALPAFSTPAFSAIDALKNFRTVEDVSRSEALLSGGKRFFVKPGAEKDMFGRSSLRIGIPLDLNGDNLLFGSVITKVSERENSTLGNMKLGAFNMPAQLRFAGAGGLEKFQVWSTSLEGETGAQVLRLELPVEEVDAANKVAYVDMAGAAAKLDFQTLYFENSRWADESGETHLRALASRTVAVDFTDTTFVFDIETDYEYAPPAAREGEAPPAPTLVTFTTRWFLRMNSVLSGGFVPRLETPGVGYFTTSRKDGGPSLITRFSIENLRQNPIKYYLKNVPARYLAAFTASFEDWNDRLAPVLGARFVAYEVLAADDPRNQQIVTGDIRYNVLEWDLDNQADYGGLGPSLYHPLTGETLAAQTLIQGPTIETLYKSWFRAEKEGGRGVNDMRETLRLALALKERAKTRTVAKWSGVQLAMPGSDARVRDPLIQNPMDFIERPEGYDYDSYMYGYFRDMVAHELGHNFGLRHNFRGSLGDDGTMAIGSVSRSIMEYLGREHRHLDRVGPYDVMAIAYGYLGKKPEHLDWFCTDENQAAYDFRNSSECSSGDATDDPFAWLERRLTRAMDLLVARDQVSAPEWTAEELWGASAGLVATMATYASAAPATSASWTNFYKEGRPTDSFAVPAFVLERLNSLVCSKELEAEAEKKLDPEAKAATHANIQQYRRLFFAGLAEVPSPWSLVSHASFSCIPPAR